LEELEEQRRQNEERLRELEEIWMRKKQNSGVGRQIREKMGFKEEEPVDLDRGEEGEEDDQEEEIDHYQSAKPKKDSITFGIDHKKDQKSDKKKKSVKIKEGETILGPSSKTIDIPNRGSVVSKSRSQSRKRSYSPFP
jgi:hypothetical protein